MVHGVAYRVGNLWVGLLLFNTAIRIRQAIKHKKRRTNLESNPSHLVQNKMHYTH